jgi:hypothetical protein
VTRLLVYCGSINCSHSSTIAGDPFPEDFVPRSLGPRMVCKACGHVGADVRPDWSQRRKSAGRWPSPPLEGAIAAVRLTGSKIPRVSTIRNPSLAPGGCPCMVPFGFFLWRDGRALHNFRRRFLKRNGSHSMRWRGWYKRRLRVVNNPLSLDARLYQPMETDRKYSIHAQTDRDCCC